MIERYLQVNLRGATYNINMIGQLGGTAQEHGLVAAPGMASSDVLPLISGTDVAAAADAVLQDFGAYVGQVHALPCWPFSGVLCVGCMSADFAKASWQQVTDHAWLVADSRECNSKLEPEGLSMILTYLSCRPCSWFPSCVPLVPLPRISLQPLAVR